MLAIGPGHVGAPDLALAPLAEPLDELVAADPLSGSVGSRCNGSASAGPNGCDRLMTVPVSASSHEQL